ncbi:MAG: hypothetical protein ACTHU0_22785 [Kofleriaceae bacterium]
MGRADREPADQQRARPEQFALERGPTSEAIGAVIASSISVSGAASIVEANMQGHRQHARLPLRRLRLGARAMRIPCVVVGVLARLLQTPIIGYVLGRVMVRRLTRVLASNEARQR